MVSGEAVKAPRVDDRVVDAPGRIEVSAALPVAPERRGGLWLVVLVYLMAGAALAYAIWERFLRS